VALWQISTFDFKQKLRKYSKPMFDDMFLFVNRTEAGEKLAAELLTEPLVTETPKEKLLVLSIPRGGVVVGAATAQILDCSHQVVVVKKIGFPGHKEMAIGALAEDGTIVLNRHITGASGLDAHIKQTKAQLQVQIAAYIDKFRQGRPLDLPGKTVIIVDDGVATGETMKAAVTWLKSKERAERPEHVLAAAPVCSPPAAAALGKIADKLVCVAIPQQFWAVGQFYWDFDQINDDEVLEYLSTG